MEIIRPFTFIRNLFWENNKESRELSKFIFEKNDSFMLWILGLAFAFIAGIITNIEKLNSLHITPHLRLVIGLLLCSIILGIFYRMLFLKYFLFLDAIHAQISIALGNKTYHETESQLTGNETFNDLISLNSEFQYSREACDLYNLASESDKEILKLSQIDLYKRNIEWAKRDLENGFKTINDVYKETYGVRYNFEKIKDGERKFKVIHFRILIFTLYSSSVICFILALALFSYFVLNTFVK